MIIAIDGPAGAGKSTVAKALANRLGFHYLDSGAMYRGVWGNAAELASELRIELVGPLVLIDGRDVTAEIRAPEVSERASQIAADPAVRAALVPLQRQLVASGDWVAEGRDIGTVVAPHAELKVFLTASAQARAHRRGDESPASIAARDERDTTRADSPLREAPDAQVIDTTDLTIDEVVVRIAALAASLETAR